jgi:RND family efflux transporter MFP subunit
MKILFLLCMLLPAACHMPEQEEKKASKKDPIPVEGVMVARSIMERVISVSGTVAGKREAVVVSETQGTIRSVDFNLGQWVKKGARLVQVDSTVQNSALEQAKKAADAAELHLNVTQKLYDAKNASDAELKTALNRHAGAKAQLDAAQKTYNDCRIAAPVSGYIALKESAVQKGNFLGPGAVVARIVNISTLKASVSVGEMEVVLLKKGMKAKLRVPATGDSVYDGKITAVAAGSDPATGAYSFEVEWKNTSDRKVKSGMSVRVEVKTEHPDSVIVVPAAAVVERDRKDAVFISIQDKAALRFVDLGRVIGNDVEITQGLNQGDILITSGLRDLKRGESVKITMTEQGGNSDEHR